MVRVTQEGMVHNALLRLEQRITSLDRAGRRLSSGKNVQLASDDVSGMNRILGLRARLRSREQEARNGADALTMLNIADSKLQTVSTRLMRVRDLTVRAASVTDAQAREAIAQEIEAIRDDIRGQANTIIDGRALFSGTANPAETIGAGPAYTNAGNDADIERRVGDQDVVTVNVTAEEAFGYADNDNIFAMLDAVVADVRAGDTVAVSAGLGRIDGAMQRINRSLAKVGAATNRVEAAMLRNTDEQLALKGELAKVEDVDLAEAIMDLQTQEVAYQATLAALSRVLQPSLVEFLR